MRTRHSVGGVSSKCIVHVGPKPRTLRVGALHQRQEDARELRASLLKSTILSIYWIHAYDLPELPLRERERLLSAESNQSRPGSSSATPSDTFDFSAYDLDIDAMLPPPGEEGFTVSHAGDEVALYKELEQITMAQPRYVLAHLFVGNALTQKPSTEG